MVTFNVRHARDTTAIHDDLMDLVAHGADVLGLQEMGDVHQPAIDNLPSNWRNYTPPPGQYGGRLDVPIAWNTNKFDFLDSGWVLCTEPQKVEYDANGGGSDVEEKTITWVKLTHTESGARITFANAHSIAGVEGSNGPADRPERLRVFDKMMDDMVDLVATRKANEPGQSIVFTGDYNVDYTKDEQMRDPRFPFAKWSQVDLRASYRLLGDPGIGSVGGRLIDYVAHSAGRRLTPRAQLVMTSGIYGSDHQPVKVSYNVHPL